MNIFKKIRDLVFPIKPFKKQSYIKGATEQQIIDIENASNILSDVLSSHLHGGEIDEVIEEFQEAMYKNLKNEQ